MAYKVKDFLAVESGVMLGALSNPTDASALLQMDSTTQGLLLPRMTTAQRDAIVNPADGLQIYNTDTGSVEIFSGGGTVWGEVSSSAGLRLPTLLMPLTSTPSTGLGSIVHSDSPWGDGKVVSLGDSDASAATEWTFPFKWSFASGDTFQYRLEILSETVSANQVIRVFFGDAANNSFSHLIEIGAGGAALVGSPTDGGNVSSSWTLTELDRGVVKLTRVDVVITWSGASGSSPAIKLQPAYNLNGSTTVDTAAQGSALVYDLQVGAPAEFDTGSAEVVNLNVADAAALAALTPSAAGEWAQVLDLDGLGRQGWYLYSGSAWQLVQYETYRYSNIADLTALAAITTKQDGDTAVVLDSDGNGNLATYIFHGGAWVSMAERGQRVFDALADAAALAALAGHREGDIAQVLDSDGNSREAFYVYDGAAWDRISYDPVDHGVVANAAALAALTSLEDGDFAQVTDADGSGREIRYLRAGGAWEEVTAKSVAYTPADAATHSAITTQRDGDTSTLGDSGVKYIHVGGAWQQVETHEDHALHQVMLPAGLAPTVGAGLCTQVGGPWGGSALSSLSDADAAAITSYDVPLGSLAFSSGDTYQIRLQVPLDVANAAHTIQVGYVDDANSAVELINIGSGGSTVVAGGPADTGNVTATASTTDYDRGNNPIVQIDLVLTWSGVSAANPKLRFQPVYNLDGTATGAVAATGSASIAMLEMKSTAEFQVGNQEVIQSKVDSSAGATDKVLEAANGTNQAILFTNADVQTNTAKLSVQAGESLNGVVDAEYIFSNFPDGTQFLATSPAAGSWNVSVVGTTTSVDRSYHIQGVLNDYNPVAGFNGVDMSTLVSGGALTLNESDSAGWRTAGNTLTVPTGLGGKRYRINVTIWHPSTAITGPSSQGDLGSPYPAIVYNGTEIGLGGIDSTTGTPEGMAGSIELLLSDGDTIVPGYGGGIVETGEDFYVQISINPVSVGDYVLAGMVATTPLKRVRYSLTADAAGIVCPWDEGVGDTSDIINTAGTIKLPPGRYRIQPHATAQGASLDYELYNLTAGTVLEKYTVTDTTTAQNASNMPYYLTVTQATDIQVREGNGDLSVTWNGRDAGVNSFPNSQQTSSSWIDIQQLPESVVVDPGSLAVENLTDSKVVMGADHDMTGTGGIGAFEDLNGNGAGALLQITVPANQRALIYADAEAATNGSDDDGAKVRLYDVTNATAITERYLTYWGDSGQLGAGAGATVSHKGAGTLIYIHSPASVDTTYKLQGAQTSDAYQNLIAGTTVLGYVGISGKSIVDSQSLQITDSAPFLNDSYKHIAGDGVMYADLKRVLSGVSTSAITNPGELQIASNLFGQVFDINGVADTTTLIPAASISRLVACGGSVAVSGGTQRPVPHDNGTDYGYVEINGAGDLVLRSGVLHTSPQYIWVEYTK